VADTNKNNCTESTWDALRLEPLPEEEDTEKCRRLLLCPQVDWLLCPQVDWLLPFPSSWFSFPSREERRATAGTA